MLGLEPPELNCVSLGFWESSHVPHLGGPRRTSVMDGASVATLWVGLMVQPGQVAGKLRKATVFSWTNRLMLTTEKGFCAGSPVVSSGG